MRVVFLNGNPHQDMLGFDHYLKRLEELLEKQGHMSRTMVLRDMKLKYCTGCFGCWLKTPGECVGRDDSTGVCREMIQSDLVIFASPVIMGFTSALLKKAHDKMIPLIHPYIGIKQGEFHHRARYKKVPKMGVLLALDSNTDDEDLAIIQEIYRRDSMNFHTSLALFKDTREKAEEVAYAISSL